MLIPNPIFNQEIHYVIQIYSTNKTRKSVDGEPSHIPALIKANRIEASYFLAYVENQFSLKILKRQ